MFGWFGVVKYVLILSIVAGGIGYVYKLRADNAILKANAIKMDPNVLMPLDWMNYKAVP